MSEKHIVILGAGYGGLKAAKALHKELRKHSDVKISLIDQNEHHTLLTEIHEVAGHRIEPGGVKVSIGHILEYTKVNFIKDRIERADLKAKKLYSKGSQYDFDYLLLGLGSEPAFFNIEGMKEHSFPLWSLDDAKKIRQHIINAFKKASKERDIGIKKRLLTFVVGGGGFTGIEMMGELIEWTKDLCKEYGISKEDVSLIQVEGLPNLCPGLDPKLGERIRRYLSKKGVKVLTDSFITSVSPDSIKLGPETIIQTETLIWTGGIKANSLVKDLGISLGDKDRIVVNSFLQTIEYPYVYAIGDNMEFRGEDGEILPPLVETATQSASLASHNIAAQIKGRDQKKLKANLHGVMVSVGSYFSVAQLGGMPLMAGLLATLIKHMVNIHYLFDIGGLELIFDYINHQFFHKSRKYNKVVESGISHIGRKNHTIWLVPLRIWLGIMWITPGIQKIQAGWLGNSVMLGLGTPDSTASASLTLLTGPNSPSWYVWVSENIILPNALIFQKVIALTEFSLGLAFILGIFTVGAALVSLGMNLNFALGTGLPQANIGWIMAAIAMFAGGGRVLGLDHYIMPFLRNQLRYFRDNKKINILKGWEL